MLKVNLIETHTYKGKDLDKLQRTFRLIEETINGEAFESAVLNFKSFQFVKYQCMFSIKTKTIPLKEYTNKELYEVLMGGHHKVGDDTFMDLKLELADGGGGSAIGVTNNNNVITTYRKAFDRLNEAELAAHLVHEWTHTMGFEHSYSNKCDSKRDCYSVPYAIGNIVEIILTGKCYYECIY